MDPAFIEDVCSTLQTAVEIIRSAADASAPSPSRDRVAAVAQGIKSEAAKVGYMFSQKNQPDKVGGEALIAGLRDTATTLCMLFAAAASGGGPTLRKSLENTMHALVESTIALIRASAAASTVENSAQVLPKFAGLVMERCDLAEKAPLDDRTAIGRALTSVARQLADAASELLEELTSAGFGEDGADDDDDDEEERQKEIINAAMLVIQAAGNVVRITMRLLLTADASPEQQGELWESILFHGKQLAGAVDDLAIASYSAEEHEDVRGAAEAVVTGCQLIGEEIDGEALRQGVAAVEEAGEKLMSLLA
jgi:Grap2 and cyclin-D-interacting